MADNKRLLQDNQNFGNYRVVSLLGRSGMGEVYRMLRQEYAVKMLLPDFTGRTGCFFFIFFLPWQRRIKRWCIVI